MSDAEVQAYLLGFLSGFLATLVMTLVQHRLRIVEHKRKLYHELEQASLIEEKGGPTHALYSMHQDKWHDRSRSLIAYGFYSMLIIVILILLFSYFEPLLKTYQPILFLRFPYIAVFFMAIWTMALVTGIIIAIWVDFQEPPRNNS